MRVEYGERGTFLVTCQAPHPPIERPRLPLRATTEALGDLRRRRYADRVKVVARDAGKPEPSKLADEGGLSRSRGSNDEQHRGRLAISMHHQVVSRM